LSSYIAPAPAGDIAGGTALAYNLMNPRYGLKGDGSDEAAALNKALALIPAGSVVEFPVPPVSYGISGTVTPQANQTLRGAGRLSTIVQRLNGANVKMFGCEGIAGLTFEDLGFDMNDANQVAGTIPALRFSGTSHYHAVRRCSFINSKSFTIYTNVTGALGPGQQALAARYEDNEITTLAGAVNDVLIPVAQGGYTKGNKILNGAGTAAADINLYESNDHICTGNVVDKSAGPSSGRALALSSVVRCPAIGNILIGNGTTGATLIGIFINKESDNGANAREQLDAECSGNVVDGFGRAYQLHNGDVAFNLGAVANTRIAGGRIANCNTGIEFHAGLIVGVNVDHVDFVNTTRAWLNTVVPQFVKFHDCAGVNPFGKLIAPAVAASTVDMLNNLYTDGMVYLVGGTVTAIKIGMPPPVIVSLTTSPTGGTLVPGTYSYIVSMVDTTGNETLGSVEATIVVPAGTNTNKVTITWYQWFGGLRLTTQPSYRVYGRTTGGELKIANNLPANVFVDDGSVAPAGALPATNATAQATGLVAASGVPVSFHLPAWMTAAYTYSVAPTHTWWGT
jgi:hypothetical protein